MTVTTSVFPTYDLYQGTYASMPTTISPAGGRAAIYECSDTGSVFLWNAAKGAWGSISGDLFMPQTASLWSVRTGGQTTAISDTAQGTLLDFGQTAAATQSGPFPFFYQNVPTGGVAWKSRFLINPTYAIYPGGFGVGVAVSDGTKASVLLQIANATNDTNSLAIYKFSNMNTSPTITVTLVNQWPGFMFKGLAIDGDGTNLIYKISMDGQNWTTHYKEAATVGFASYSAVTQAGIFADMGPQGTPYYQDHIYATVPWSYVGT